MTDEEELQMATSISRWRREQPKGQRRRQEREIVPRAESWEDKYDRLCRELKPSERFGTTFSAKFRRNA